MEKGAHKTSAERTEKSFVSLCWTLIMFLVRGETRRALVSIHSRLGQTSRADFPVEAVTGNLPGVASQRTCRASLLFI